MKVKAIFPVAGAYSIRAGETGELPDDMAKAFIKAGSCEAVEEPKKTTKKPAAKK